MSVDGLIGPELIDFVKQVLGARLDQVTADPAGASLTGRLYGRFPFSLEVEAPHLTLATGIRVGQYSVTGLGGRIASTERDPDSLRRTLALYDEWCRLRLGEAAVAAFDHAHGTGPVTA